MKVTLLRLKYVDLYLIHNPRTLPDVDGVWKEFEKIQKDGLAKSIGVSNFTLEALQSLVKKAQVWPAFNQVEFHPYNYAQNKALLEWSTKQGIVIEGYSSLSSITKFPGGPVDVPVAAAATCLGISPTQVLLSWVRAESVVIVTTTSTRAGLRSTSLLETFRLAVSLVRSPESARTRTPRSNVFCTRCICLMCYVHLPGWRPTPER
ncbi:NADP-dependent oxidoreductase domain-containing protein [Mycena galopus ATCC 62051]|nr:NADP-dependent oxidoreductase domain-containing protein [Mycena galopus ATCC 62051]